MPLKRSKPWPCSARFRQTRLLSEAFPLHNEGVSRRYTASHKNVRAGDIIFRDGDAGDCAYLIESGEVVVLKSIQGEDSVVATFGEGEIFGEMAILDGAPRSATAKASQECKLIVIHRDQFFDQLKQTTPITAFLIRILLKRIRQTTDKLTGFSGTSPSLGAVPDLLESMKAASEKDAIDRIRLGSELRGALVNNEFRLYYQPIVDLNDQRVIGFEALIRWESPTRGLVPPIEFIDLLEESSLIHPIGDWIQKRAFWDLQALAKKFGPEVFVSLNISVRQLENRLFLESLFQNTEQFSINPEKVKLEITERILLDGQTGLAALAEVKKAGYLISIDDFGTGYSNFQSLTQFGFDSLKLDRAFLRAAMMDPKMEVVLKGIIDIASGLEMGLIAEGIETEIERAKLKELGVPMGQGYLFSKPQPLARLTA